MREVTQDVVPLVVQSRAADLDQPGVIGPAVETQLPQPCRIKGFWRRGRAGAFVEVPHGRMFGKVHDRPSFIAYASTCRKKHSLSVTGLSQAHFLGGFVEQGDPLVP